LRERRRRRRAAEEVETREVNGVGDQAAEVAIAVGIASGNAWRSGAAQEVEVEHEDCIGHDAAHFSVTITVTTKEQHPLEPRRRKRRSL
jgi:hypothetical protein